MGYVFSMIIWSEFRIGQYRDVKHREDARHFTNLVFRRNLFFCILYIKAIRFCRACRSEIVTSSFSLNSFIGFKVKYIPNCLETISFRCFRLILNAIKATIKKKMKKPVSSLFKRSIFHDLVWPQIGRPCKIDRSLVYCPKSSELLTSFHILDLQVSLVPNFYFARILPFHLAFYRWQQVQRTMDRVTELNQSSDQTDGNPSDYDGLPLMIISFVFFSFFIAGTSICSHVE